MTGEKIIIQNGRLNVPDYPMKIIKGADDDYNLFVELLSYKKVKSFAPGISHYVFDLKIDKK